MRFGVEEVAEREGCRCRQEQPIEGRVTAGAFASKSMPILDHVRVCDCSICKRRGALIHRVEPKFSVYSLRWMILACTLSTLT